MDMIIMELENEWREYTYQWLPEKYDDEKEPILKISKSSFGSYQWCPKRYEFQYILKMPIDTSEAMYKGTVIHNAREDFFNTFDIKKAENLSHSELVDYCLSLYPIDDYTDMYQTMSIFEANRFQEAKEEGTLEDFLPVINEILLDAEITIAADTHPDYPLTRDYKVHLQGIIDRMFKDGDIYVPLELKTGAWKDWKKTMMRKEMAFYKILFENTPDEKLVEMGLDPEIPISHWGWYYPDSNHIYVEDAKKSSINSVMKGIAKLLHAYENEQFETKYFYKTCANCSFFGICEAADAESWI